ncbi:RnfH family protein [Acinetobacter higginsii]|uniref:RnfH family protein n=1 Tax=Acinetobacter higginsii TaxID=70347 RepID=UPI001F4B5301|nr:RnfH family protein [Acinetobacter higginsii]MCH7294397.1 RnfH family protein [Acinetobacter higginsii]MCH7303095.1 RnfH family protein [Acinetobacter higginsii]MCH7338238.1 RnfH family protein [Acinetobacter higginsii]
MEQAKQVWVAFSSPEQQFHIAVSFSEGMTAQQAIDASGLAAQATLPEVLQLGVFGSRIDADTVLQAGDRVEIYRALTINPNDIRRKRAAKNPVGRFIKGNRFKA